MKTPRTPSNIVVKPLDFAAFCVAAVEHINKQHEPAASPCVKAAILGALAIVETPKGLIVIENEGVIHLELVTEEKGYGLDFYGEYQDGSVDTMPVIRRTFKASELKTLTTQEPVSLEDFIRRFGARLEKNYEIVRKELTKLLA